MKFSPFNPIYFYKTGVTDHNAMTGYVHTYSPDDFINIELLHNVSEIIDPLILLDANSGDPIIELSWNTFAINNTDRVTFYELRDTTPGFYILSFGDWISNVIHITDDPILLENTILIQYANSSNAVRLDVYPNIKNRLRYFEIRLIGGFKDNGWSFSVENEQFLTDKSDIVEIYAIESTDKILTVGNSGGVPTWIGEILNHIIACELIFIDGDRYSYVGSNSIDVSDGNTDGNRFVYSVTMRKAKYINAAFERAIRSLFRKVPSNLRSVNGHLRKL